MSIDCYINLKLEIIFSIIVIAMQLYLIKIDLKLFGNKFVGGL